VSVFRRMNSYTFELRTTVAFAKPFSNDTSVVASAGSETSPPRSNTMTVASATNATVTATSNITPITGETPLLSNLFVYFSIIQLYYS